MGHLSWVTSMSVWLSFSTTVFMITAHVSLLWLLRLYKYEQIHPATWYLILTVLVCGPHVTNLLYLLWKTPILTAARKVNFPNTSHVFLGVISGILEGVSTSVFACEVAHYLPEPVLMTLPSATLAFVTFRDIHKHFKKSSTKPKCDTPSIQAGHRLTQTIQSLSACYMVVVVSVVGGLLCQWSSFGLTTEGCIILVISTPLLAAIWLPAVQQLIHKGNAAGKSGNLIDLLYTLVRIAAICLTLYLSIFFKLDEFRNFPWQCVMLGLTELSNYTIWFPVVCCSCGAALSSLNVWASFKVGLPAPGVKIPLVLCVPLSVILTAVLWNDFQTEAFWEVTAPDNIAWVSIILSLVCWLIPFCLPGFLGFKSQTLHSKPFYERLSELSWNLFFLEPKMLLMNYVEHDLSCGLKEGNRTTQNNPSVIYICTTMYKESQIEMLRYLSSIKQVFETNDRKKMQLEAHVFFDSAVKCDKINSRARHLLSLLCRTFTVSMSQLTKVSTPYGCQISTGDLLNYPLCIHFKDGNQVKCKKRWSQVMYLHYMLNYKQKGYQGDQISKSGWRLKTSQGTVPFYPPNGSDCSSSGEYQSSSTLFTDILLVDQGMVNSAQQITSQHVGSESYAAHIPQSLNISDFYNNVDRLPLASSSLYTSTQSDTGQLNCRVLDSRKSSFSFGSERDQSSSAGSYSTDVTSSWDNDKVFMTEASTLQHNTQDEDVFILTTDADTEFTSESVSKVLEQCQSDDNIGAVCGRTVPIGSTKPIVWYQKFEYAKDFWLVKSSQNIIGSVTCCPGCFSIYRGAALTAVLPEFCKATSSAFDNLVMDHGEDRWLCTLLMQRGWRLAYSSHAHNSTHCPETVGEFLRQRRRWVLSELSNTADIFMSIADLVKNNASFSAMFLISLFSTFLWVILSPSTTLVFMCAGFDVLFGVKMTWTLPLALSSFLGYCLLCTLASQGQQKIVSIVMIAVLASTVLALSFGFIVYIVHSAETDMADLGYVQFRPYFLVFLLIIAIVYAAALHPKESPCLVYGFAYALLFPAMFVVLPVYGVANMLDQSWGTREAGSHGCCQVPAEEEDESTFINCDVTISDLPELRSPQGGDTEHEFWIHLVSTYIGNDVNMGTSDDHLRNDLHRLRSRTMSGLVVSNFLWFICLSVLYAFAGSDVICYCVASVFSFTLLVQLVGLTCFKFNDVIDSRLKRNVSDYVKK